MTFLACGGSGCVCTRLVFGGRAKSTPLYSSLGQPGFSLANALAFGTDLPPAPTSYAGPGGGGVLPYVRYMGMCRCEGYGFQAV